MSKLVGAMAVVVAAVAGLLGVAWIFLDAIGTEWDYCRRGGACIPGGVMGTVFTLAAIVAAFVGVTLLRQRGPRSGRGS